MPLICEQNSSTMPMVRLQAANCAGQENMERSSASITEAQYHNDTTCTVTG